MKAKSSTETNQEFNAGSLAAKPALYPRGNI